MKQVSQARRRFSLNKWIVLCVILSTDPLCSYVWSLHTIFCHHVKCLLQKAFTRRSMFQLLFSACESLGRKLATLFGLNEPRYKHTVEEDCRTQNQVSKICILLRRMKRTCFIRLCLNLLLWFTPQKMLKADFSPEQSTVGPNLDL